MKTCKKCGANLDCGERCECESFVMPQELPTIGFAITQMLANINMTRRELAQAVGVYEHTVIEIIAGARSVSPQMLIKLSKALRVSISYLNGRASR